MSFGDLVMGSTWSTFPASSGLKMWSVYGTDGPTEADAIAFAVAHTTKNGPAVASEGSRTTASGKTYHFTRWYPDDAVEPDPAEFEFATTWVFLAVDIPEATSWHRVGEDAFFDIVAARAEWDRLEAKSKEGT